MKVQTTTVSKEVSAFPVSRIRIFKSLEACMNLEFRSRLSSTEIVLIQVWSFEIKAFTDIQSYIIFILNYHICNIIWRLYDSKSTWIKQDKNVFKCIFIFNTINFYFDYVTQIICNTEKRPPWRLKYNLIVVWSRWRRFYEQKK